MARSRPRRRPCTGSRGAVRTPLTAAAVLAVTAAAAVAGCSIQEAVCRGGEYPVMTVGDTGSACVPDGEEPSEGYTRHPEGKLPRTVDDTWDRYWRTHTHTLDEKGNILDAPAPR
ncbi:SCO0607 family lipoprotein [Streptomyces sp. cmx-4-9]|uniref:SCO0607 family lipoprotein n=1 Tax=Streptomyces sp. cmx-4-9 TaxID=2790941 RepID=UPI00397FB329